MNKTFRSQHHIGAENLEDWRSLCHAVHEAGGRMSAQLHHPGLFCMAGKGTPMGPSFFYLPSKLAWPKTMTIQDVLDVKREYIEAAELCAEVGFDCIELHCGHGYLLSQFLTPAVNRRRDRYGGDTAGRAQLPVEIIQEIRGALGADFPIVAKLNTDDGWRMPGGLKLEAALETARLLAAAGCNAIVPSYGYTSVNGFGMLRGGVPLDRMAEAFNSRWVKWMGPYFIPKIEFEPLFLRESSQRFVQTLENTSTSVIYVGGAESFQGIEDVLRDGCVAVQMGRPLIREPFFVLRLRLEVEKAERLEDVDVNSKCIRCNLCVLASMDPVRFKAGCPWLKPGEGRDIEDIEAVPRL